MKIISSLTDNVWHKLGNSSYEWWYFDAISDDGYSVVITFFCGLPFSPYYNEKIVQMQEGKGIADPKQHTAFYFCLYKNNKLLAYVLSEYSEKHFFAALDQTKVIIGNNILVHSSDKGFSIKIDDLALWGRKIKGEVCFQPEFFPKIDWLTGEHEHVWNCVAPRCKVNGELTITGLVKKRKIKFFGIGYHDHNYGNRPMHHDISRWHWGRLHTKDQTAIYYITESKNDPKPFLMVLKNNGEVFYLGQANYDFKQKKDLMGVEYFSQINLAPKGENGFSLDIFKTQTVDQGPFYLRFLADYKLKSSKSVTENIGFAEAFEPQKLFIKAFWPFIKMPIKKLS